jgi:hypothetical protein
MDDIGVELSHPDRQRGVPRLRLAQITNFHFENKMQT